MNHRIGMVFVALALATGCAAAAPEYGREAEPVAACAMPSGRYMLALDEQAIGCAGPATAHAHYAATYPIGADSPCFARYEWDEASRTDLVHIECQDGEVIETRLTWSCDGTHGEGTHTFTLGKCQISGTATAESIP